MTEKTCLACKYSYMEPDTDLICGHKDTGSVFGQIARTAASDGGHCRQERRKFEQHPLRTPEGLLKS